MTDCLWYKWFAWPIKQINSIFKCVCCKTWICQWLVFVGQPRFCQSVQIFINCLWWSPSLLCSIKHVRSCKGKRMLQFSIWVCTAGLTSLLRCLCILDTQYILCQKQRVLYAIRKTIRQFFGHSAFTVLKLSRLPYRLVVQGAVRWKAEQTDGWCTMLVTGEDVSIKPGVKQLYTDSWKAWQQPQTLWKKVRM